VYKILLKVQVFFPDKGSYVIVASLEKRRRNTPTFDLAKNLTYLDGF
jgi:hypothetical protein